MAWTLQTRDGITIKGIPDEISPDSPEVKQRVEAERQKRGATGIGYVGPTARPAPEEPTSKTDATMGMSALELFFAGMGKRAFDIGTLGLRDVPETDAMLMRNPSAQFGAGTTDLTMLAAPAVKGARMAASSRLFSRLPETLRLPIANALVSGGIEGATRPGEFGQRAENLLEGVGFSVAGEAVGRSIARGIGGPLSSARITPEAETLIREGVPVPPWKATTSRRLRDLAERGKASVAARPILTDAERRAMTAWNKTVIKKATPPRPVLDESGNVRRWVSDKVSDVSDDTINTLRSRFKESYDALYKGRVIPVDDEFRLATQDISRAVERYMPDQSESVKGVLAQIDDVMSSVKPGQKTSQILNAQGKPIVEKTLGHAGVTNETIGEAIDIAERAASEAWRSGNGRKAEAIEEIVDALAEMRRRGLPPEVQSAAKDINKAYTSFLQLRRAHSMLGAQKEGMITPGQLLNAQKALDRSSGKAAFSAGNVPNQRETINALRVLGDRLPDVGPGTAEKLIAAGMIGGPSALMGDILTGAAAASLVTPQVQRYMFGGYPLQPKLQNLLRAGIPAEEQAFRGFLLDEY